MQIDDGKYYWKDDKHSQMEHGQDHVTIIHIFWELSLQSRP